MNNPKVLIAEDEAIVAFVLRRKLASWGFDPISVVHTGKEAIEAFDREAPDVAILDIFLADSVDGIAVAEHIRRVKPTPVVFVTASQDRETQARALETSPAAIVHKPYSDEKLRTALREALENVR